MPRPLKILKGIIEEDPSVTHSKTSELLGETVTIAEDALRQLSTCLRLLLNKDRASKADQSILDLGIRLWNDIRAGNILIHEGFILHAEMMQRDTIETRVVAEYLHTHPQEAEAWQKAEDKKERLRFGMNELKDKVEGGKDWKDMWDDCSSRIHATSAAIPAYSRMRPGFGYNLYLGGFYNPIPIAVLFGTQLAICINFLESFMNWYKDDLPFPTELPKQIEVLEDTYSNQIDKLKKRARAEQQKMDDEIKATRLSEDEIVKLFKFLDTLP